jgi:hypothetical protein
MPRALALVAAVALVALSGCVTNLTAEEACEEHRRLLNEISARCGLAPVPDNWYLWAEGPCEGMTTSCAFVNQVARPHELLEGCFPLLETISCDDYLTQGEPEFCAEQYEDVSSQLVCTP